MPAASPTERKLVAQIASNTFWAATDARERAAHTAHARRAFNDRFLNEVDPARTLPESERAERAERARKAYFSRMALKSAQARRRKAAKAKR